MTSSLERFGIRLALVVFASIFPATVRAQCPTYITQWGSVGSGDRQFDHPGGVATDTAGDVYITDGGNQRVQKFSPALVPINAASWGHLKTLYH